MIQRVIQEGSPSWKVKGKSLGVGGGVRGGEGLRVWDPILGWIGDSEGGGVVLHNIRIWLIERIFSWLCLVVSPVFVPRFCVLGDLGRIVFYLVGLLVPVFCETA
jgi:hypothetical protein